MVPVEYQFVPYYDTVLCDDFIWNNKFATAKVLQEGSKEGAHPHLSFLLKFVENNKIVPVTVTVTQTQSYWNHFTELDMTFFLKKYGAEPIP